MKCFFLITTVVVLCNWGHSAPTDLKEEETSTIEPLMQHLKDFAQLLPKDLVKDIASKHLDTDDEFKAAIIYMQSEEWVNLVETVRGKQEWIALKEFLKKSGIDLDIIIHCVESFIQNATVTLEPTDPPPKKSFRSFLMDVEQNLPVAKIITAWHEKMSKGTTFQELFERLSSEESHKLVEGVVQLPEVKRMVMILTDMDLNLSGMFALMYTFFGWGEFKLA